MKIRPVEPADLDFLAEMLCEAFAWRTGDADAVRSQLNEPHLARYLNGWGRRGDAGVVALDRSGQQTGAAWFRLFTRADHGYGYVNKDVAEVTLAVSPAARGHGVGEALMRALVDEAHRQGQDELSLSVEEDNHRALALYTKLGFRRLHLNGNAWTMHFRA